MPRRRSDADELFDDLSGLLGRVPLWVGPTLSIITYGVFRFVIPPLLHALSGESVKIVGQFMQRLAWLPAIFVLGAWVGSLVHRSRRRQLFDRQTGLKSIRQLGWREFEALIGEAFRRQGYSVLETGQSSADGGVDLVLKRAGEETLVQCKRWKEWQVGVEKVRELYGVMASRGSTSGILVTSGFFTKPARRFAEGKSLKLIEGPMLAQLVAGIQAKAAPAVLKVTDAPSDSAVCPLCGSAMTLRTAKKGPQAGSRFWGCSRFPACKGTRKHDSD